VLLFSATFGENVKQFALRTIPKANYIFVEKEALSLDAIKQYKIHCPNPGAKIDVLQNRIFPAAEKLGQSIIFVRTRHSASELHKRLEADGYKCTSIQGGLSHEERDHVIQEFRSGETKILIATDVLSRGFDQAQVTLVINYDIPVKSVPPYTPEFETYLHRIGRSGRFGRKGAAFNLLVTDQDERNLRKIEQHFNTMISDVAWDDDNAIEKVLKDAGLA
jgi:ATP-dependent RNA helicase DDX19/DBP5